MYHRQANDQGYAPVGATVFSWYWREHYTVMSHNEDGTVTVRWHGDGRALPLQGERITTHRTPMDSKDRIVNYDLSVGVE